MTPFLLYIARASLDLALFYAFYLLVMRRTSLFRFNRIALLVGTVVCHLLPLLRLRTVILKEIAVPVSLETLEGLGEPVGASAPFPWLPVLYAAGVAAILALCLVSALRTRRIIRSGNPQPCESCRLTLVEGDVPSFSWGRQVVMSRSDYEKYPAILAHELQHIRAHHSTDVLLMTAVTAVHWFNPLVWIARAELRLLHEYEADEGLIRQGIDATSYQLLLVRKAVGEQRFSLANGFNHAKLKQRIAMMHKKQTPGRVRFAYVAILPVLAATMFVCNPVRATIPEAPADQIPPTGQSIPYAQIEKKPTFNGGDAGEFSKWVAENLKYPKEAYEDGISGRVMVQFTISTDGSVRDVKVLRGVHELLDNEAVRVISSSPKWEPGIQDGKPVNVTFQFPVIFRLGETTNKQENLTIQHEKGEEIHAGFSNGTLMLRTDGTGDPLIILDGKKFAGKLSDINVETIESISVLKDSAAIEQYGEEAKGGVVLIKTKK